MNVYSRIQKGKEGCWGGGGGQKLLDGRHIVTPEALPLF